MMCKKKMVTFYIEPELWEALGDLAEELSEYQEDVTTSKLARQAIRDMLTAMDKWPPNK